MPVINKEGCQTIGRVCPTGQWPTDLPTDTPILYVSPGGDGDGMTPANPMGSIQSAHDSAPDGAIIALAKGVYD